MSALGLVLRPPRWTSLHCSDRRAFTSDALSAALRRMQIFQPNTMQQRVLDAAKSGQASLLCISQTGSGKTLAFLLPLIERLRLQSSSDSGGLAACMCIAPSPELAAQHADVADEIVRSLSAEGHRDVPSIVRSADAADGGDSSGSGSGEQHASLYVSSAAEALPTLRSIRRQERSLLAVAIDEVDAILCGAAHDEQLTASGMALLDEIGSATSPHPVEAKMGMASPQLLMTTAVLTREHDAALSRRLPSAVRIQQDGAADGTGRGTLVPTLRQVFHYCSSSTKDAKLLSILAKRHDPPSPLPPPHPVVEQPQEHAAAIGGGATLIFCKDAEQVRRLRRVLLSEGGMAEGAIGMLTEASDAAARVRALQRFRQGGHEVLLATALAARGLDLPSLELCVLFDMPNDVAGYVHAAGRTARRGREGVVVCLVESQAQAKHFRALHALQAAPKLTFATRPAS